MQKSFTLLIAFAAIGFIPACSTGPVSTGSSLPAAGPSQSRGYHQSKAVKKLFVADYGLNAVEILSNSTWQNIGSITTGIDKPDGAFVDKKGNLYISNSGAVDITEYKPGTSTPNYTYSSGMLNPTDVSVDAHGNVYEADFEGGFVAEYPQGSNVQSENCAIQGWVGGVAVDKHGDVFVAFYNKDTNKGQINEYVGGLSGCIFTELGAALVFPGSMVIDAKNNLVVADQDNNTVDIIDPPYSSISGYLGSGYSDPVNVTLGKKDKLAYVDNYNFGKSATVWVENYPSGSVIATLGSGNGLSAPLSAVDGKNEVP